MKAYRQILFPTALIQQSLMIGQWAAELARNVGAKLSLLHVVEPRRSYGLGKGNGHTATESQVAEKRQQLAELGRQLSVGEADQYVRTGIPKVQILTLAEQLGPDLIVQASHAHHGYAHLLGSTAIAVAHSAACDVLTIRVGGPISKEYRHILFPTALVEHSPQVAERASLVAENTGAKLSLIHVVEPLPGYGFVSVGADEIERELELEASEQLKSLAAKFKVAEQDLYIRAGTTKSRILETADELAADLIVIGSHARRDFTHLLGSTAIAVVHSAKCDVLTVRITGL